jgi:prolyl 4-hydroxylase
MIDLPMRFEHSPLLWTVDGIYSEAECRSMIAEIDAASPTIATNNPMYRNQDRVMRDEPEKAADLFARVQPHLPTEIKDFRLVGLNERLRYYRYQPGQNFAPHMDHWYRPREDQITLYSVLVYFNDDFVGGNTRFMEQVEQVVVPRPGMAAIFQHKIRHEGCEVTQGTKYAMRTDVIFEAPGPIGHPEFTRT